MAARPTLAARAARRTARTAAPREAPATYPPPARTAEPTTARRNGGQRPVPMAPPLAAVAARAPGAYGQSYSSECQGGAVAGPNGATAYGSRSTSATGLWSILLQRRQGGAVANPYGSAAYGSRNTSATGGYGQSYSGERQGGAVANPYGSAAYGSRSTAHGHIWSILLRRASRRGGGQPLWLRRVRQSEHERHGRYGQSYSGERQGGAVANPYGSAAYGSRNTSATALTANLTPASVKAGRWPTPMALRLAVARVRAAWATTVNPTPLSATEPRQPALADMAATARTPLGPILIERSGMAGSPIRRLAMVGNPMRRRPMVHPRHSSTGRPT